MYLKEVHMENFKSFGRKLTVPFTNRFTAITGPNGAGKSNIGDAILFVLGPRSNRAVRAGKLVELIFNGGRDGKQANECTVSLTFDNTDRLMPIDEDDVTLTRRIKRRPKEDDPDHAYSYFYINGRSASLKEFADLLDHARISADGYNIVTQGHVTNVIQMGATERRRIIEKIAGITDYDKHIEKAEKQKEEVNANLERIGIVLGEIGRTLRQLKKDRDGALRYKELSDELGTKKGQHAYVIKQDVERRIANSQDKIEKLTQDRNEAVERVNQMRGEERTLTGRLETIEQEMTIAGGDELAEVQEKVKLLRVERGKAEQSANFAQDEVHELDTEIGELRRELAAIEKQHKDKLDAVVTYETHAGEVRAKAESLTKELDGIKESLAATDADAHHIQKKLAELKKRHDETHNQRHEQRLERDRLQDRQEALETLVTGLKDKLTSAKTEIDEVDWQIAELKETAEGGGAEALEKQLFTRKKRQAEVTSEINDLESVAARARRELAELRARKDAAEGVQREYSRAVDAILEARDKGMLKGICGTIAELGNVDKKYATAIETAAGGRTQCIVVETAQDAQNAIEHLRNHRLGRATFLPMDKMARNMPRGKALMAVKDEASHGFAIDLIEFNKRYESAFQFVFGDTVVVGGLDDARRIMGGVRLVTMKGDLIEASGAMTGGDSGKKGKGPGFGGVDTSKLDTLAQELSSAEGHIEALTDELTELRTLIVGLEDQLREAKGTTLDVGDRLKKLESLRAEAAKLHETTQETLHTKSTELDGLETKIAALDTVLGTFNDQLADMDAEREALSRAMIAGTKKELGDRIRGLEKELDEAREAAREAEKERDVARETAKLAIQRVDEFKERIGKLVTEQQKHREDIATFTTKMKTIDDEIEALEAETREANAAVLALHEERDQVKDDMRELRSKIDKLANQAEVNWNLILKEKDHFTTLESELGEAIADLRESGFRGDPADDYPPLPELKADIRRLEKDIDALGPINQRALEEYEEQEERQVELVDQVKHLKEERKTLEELVQEISTKKKNEFMVVFDAINENYKRVFAKLSIGGSAWLKLEDEEDPFNGGLTMMARPKGKKVLRIDAISGGEKGMAALGFIFAIQEYEPSPFYYLDEVDQNLDGVNSDTIGRTVKEYSSGAQFIVVSLRKITLKQADHIYGVTMQRVGLSDVIGNFDINRVTEDGKAVAPPSGKAKKELSPEEVVARAETEAGATDSRTDDDQPSDGNPAEEEEVRA